jgi:NifU-like protein involved in Fe-S cluster formation
LAETLSARARELFRNPSHAGHGGPGWRTGEGREPLSGATLRWHLKVEAGNITSARYEALGCPHLIAAAELAARALEGQALALARLDPAALAQAIGAPAEKRGRLLILEDALAAALLVGPGGS